jgi:hypothetical protein
MASCKRSKLARSLRSFAVVVKSVDNANAVIHATAERARHARLLTFPGRIGHVSESAMADGEPVLATLHWLAVDLQLVTQYPNRSHCKCSSCYLEARLPAEFGESLEPSS